MTTHAKGGFPRIVIELKHLDEIHDQGFSGFNIISMKKLRTNQSCNPLLLDNKNQYNIVKYDNGLLIGGGKDKTCVNGIPIDMFVK